MQRPYQLQPPMGLWLLEEAGPALPLPTSLPASQSSWDPLRPPSHSLEPFTDLTGKPVCVVRDGFSLAASPQATLLSRYLIRMPTISVPIGDPQSNRDPRLPSGGYLGHSPSPWGLYLSPRAAWLGACLGRTAAPRLGGPGGYPTIFLIFSSSCISIIPHYPTPVLRNVPLLGYEVSEE